MRRGIGHDRRIGFAFLFPGVGYGGSTANYDVAPDGRFVMIRRKNTLRPTTIEVVFNWPRALGCQQQPRLRWSGREALEQAARDRLDRRNHEAAAGVITSYSIHYTKLYECAAQA